MSLPPSDPRRSFRHPLVLQVEYPNREGYLADSTENLSIDGLFVRTDQPFAIGERIPLRLAFPGMPAPLILTGEVVWRRPGNDRHPAGVGIRIPEDCPEDRAHLQQLLSGMAPAREEDRLTEGYRILIAEDNPFTLELYDHGLQKMAASDGLTFEVVRASSGSEALAQCDAQPFSLVITGIDLPGLNGIDLIRALRSREATCHLPIIAISAGGAEAQRRAHAAGADVFLHKPIRFYDVLNTIRKFL